MKAIKLSILIVATLAVLLAILVQPSQQAHDDADGQCDHHQHGTKGRMRCCSSLSRSPITFSRSCKCGRRWGSSLESFGGIH